MRGDFNPCSDIDILAVFEKEEDIPLNELFNRERIVFCGGIEKSLIDGIIDFHFVSLNWAVFKFDENLKSKIINKINNYNKLKN